MAKQPRLGDPEALRQQLIGLLTTFEAHIRESNLRTQVKELVPAYHSLRSLGRSLMVGEGTNAARDRIILYLRKYVGEVIDGDELMVVAGISEYARRLRELRVEAGWPIVSGITAREVNLEAEQDGDESEKLPAMRPEQYMLLDLTQDRDAAHRWRIANSIRKQPGGVKEKILGYLRQNVGHAVTNEELRYVANSKSEWARRVRELRTEDGWAITTKVTGRPELSVGTYILEMDRQAPVHDRRIPDPVRRRVLVRDEYTCRQDGCGWAPDDWNRADPRHLELHHYEEHAKKGRNTEENLVTLCNVCHDEVHGGHKKSPQPLGAA